MTKNTWVPSDYSVPQSPSNYLKLAEGANKFRILSAPIMGYEYWNAKNKPVRSPEYPTQTPDIKKEGKVKHFWAMVVWNYKEKKLQIAEFTQATIQEAILALAQNEDWGNPSGYDITINAKDAGTMEVVYTIQPSPHKPIPTEAVEAFESAYINLKALYTSEDPFAQSEGNSEPHEVSDEHNPLSGQVRGPDGQVIPF